LEEGKNGEGKHGSVKKGGSFVFAEDVFPNFLQKNEDRRLGKGIQGRVRDGLTLQEVSHNHEVGRAPLVRKDRRGVGEPGFKNGSDSKRFWEGQGGEGKKKIVGHEV